MSDTPKPHKGRALGTPNRNTLRVFEILDRLGYDPVEGMCTIAMGQVRCFTCQDPFPEKHPVDPDCERCKGTGREPVPLEMRAQMHKEVAQYAYPKRRAVEVVAEPGVSQDGVPVAKMPVIEKLTGLLQ